MAMIKEFFYNLSLIILSPSLYIIFTVLLMILTAYISHDITVFHHKKHHLDDWAKGEIMARDARIEGLKQEIRFRDNRIGELISGYKRIKGTAVIDEFKAYKDG